MNINISFHDKKYFFHVNNSRIIKKRKPINSKKELYV